MTVLFTRNLDLFVDGLVTLAGAGFAGYADGTGIQAQFDYPGGLAISSTNILYLIDQRNYVVRAIMLDGDSVLIWS